MQSVVLVGEKAQQQEYISEFQRKNTIKSYSTLWIDKKIGISDVREIIKYISIKPPHNEKKLIVLGNDMTNEAQNALLKVLEDLPDFAFVIIICSKKEQLLPTILSRCTIINQSVSFKNSIIVHNDAEKIIEDFMEHYASFYHKLFLCEQLMKNSEQETVEILLLSLRGLLLKKIFDEKTSKIIDVRHIYKMIIDICILYPYIKSNNVNKRFAIESILLK